MRARRGWLAGGGGAAVAVYRRLRGQAAAEDPRAEELRRRLEESRTIAEEQHEEAASAELPVDAVVEPESGELDDRRKAVHERARAAAEEMRGGRTDGE